MNILSLSGKKVDFLCNARKFIVFDILYTEDLKPAKSLFTSGKSMADIESEIFEWSDGELIGFYTLEQSNKLVSIKVEQIKYYDENDKIESDKIFGTDSGIIAFVDWNKIDTFLETFNYDDFVDILPNPDNANNYLNKVVSLIGNSFAIMSTPGLDKGYDFVGSGQYYVEKNDL